MAHASPVLCIDTGAHSIKACWADPSSTAPSDIQSYRNAVVRSKTARRNYVADEFDGCEDFGGLTFRVPMERGILNNWEVEKGVWDRVFGSKGRGLKVSPPSTSLLVTEPVFNLPNVQEHYDQIVFEEYEFVSYLRAPGPALIPYGPDARPSNSPAEAAPECVLVVDCGFSFTHVVPVLRGGIAGKGVRRIDVGGKLLTNYLKELVSYRHWYMMDQTSVMECAKEKTCYVTRTWEEDWEVANKPNNHITRTFVLPDFTLESTNKLGYVRTGLTPPPREPTPPPIDPNAPWTAVPPAVAKEKEEEQLLFLANERFTVPEVLFNPSTIDLNQSGLPEAIAGAITALPEELQGMFWANIICVGGSVAFEGFGDRLQADLRTYAPPDCEVRVTVSSDPINALALSASSALSYPSALSFTHPAPLSSPEAFVTRAEYQESGSNACRRKFGRFYWKEKGKGVAMGGVEEELGMGG
ncbi:hypothetical protein JCM11641_006924 [Rhodosporidiobolus odoratus]